MGGLDGSSGRLESFSQRRLPVSQVPLQPSPSSATSVSRVAGIWGQLAACFSGTCGLHSVLMPPVPRPLQISRQSIDALKDWFRDEMQKSDWQLIVELKKVFEII